MNWRERVSRGEQYRIRKNWNPYIFFQINALIDIKSRLLIFVMQIQPQSLKLWCFLYFMNEKFNKNAKVEKLTKKVGRGVRLIVIGP